LFYDVTAGAITARVQGSRVRPYSVSIRLKPLDDRSWHRVAGVMARQAAFAAMLLAGEMPRDIETAFVEAGTSLFPQSRGDLESRCSCPDWANPCKHVAAVAYVVAEAFDRDPVETGPVRAWICLRFGAAARRPWNGPSGWRSLRRPVWS